MHASYSIRAEIPICEPISCPSDFQGRMWIATVGCAPFAAISPQHIKLERVLLATHRKFAERRLVTPRGAARGGRSRPPRPGRDGFCRGTFVCDGRCRVADQSDFLFQAGHLTTGRRLERLEVREHQTREHRPGARRHGFGERIAIRDHGLISEPVNDILGFQRRGDGQSNAKGCRTRS